RESGAGAADVSGGLAGVGTRDSGIAPPTWLDDADDLPAATEMFPLANGLLHLPSGDLYLPTANHFGLAASEVAFDPDAPDPKHWLAFLDDLFATDEGAITALQDWFGYALSTDTSQQKILFVVGPRRSGKGTIARVLTALVGRDSVANPTPASLQTTFGLAPLIGKATRLHHRRPLGRPQRSGRHHRALALDLGRGRAHHRPQAHRRLDRPPTDALHHPHQRAAAHLR